MSKSIIQSGCLLFCSLIASMPSAAQEIKADGTTSTTVTSPDGNNFTIDGGDRPEGGANLFHSFQDFSVPTGGSASFNNAVDIQNIFSRVTGGNVSSLDGLIRASGNANLFLINPAGIIFGQNARLDIGGSFLGSTADSILFPEGEFLATDTETPPLLTINAPIGLNFRDEPAPITNRFDDGSGNLTVLPGANLTLVGGDINFENIGVYARGGRVNLGGLSEAGTVTINEDSSLSFPNGRERADVSFTNNAFVDVRGVDGGSITVHARNVELFPGEIGVSSFLAGIAENSGSSTAQAGDITINATDNIFLEESTIANEVSLSGQGQGGGINITANSVSLRKGSALSADTIGQGDAGNIIINATESISLTGLGSDGFGSRIVARVLQVATGRGGDVNITTNTLSLNEGNILTSTQGKGDGGNIAIKAKNIVLDGSVIRSSVSSTEIGNAGSIKIKTDSLDLANDTVLRTNTVGQGNANSIEITANSVSLDNGSELRSDTSAKGNAGNIIINATESIFFSGVDSDGFGSGIFARVQKGGTGTGGNVELTTTNLSLTERAQIVTDTQGKGDGGNITVDATKIFLDGSDIRSAVGAEVMGKAGKISIKADSLSLNNGAEINTSTLGLGDAGTIKIQVNSVAVNSGSEIRSDTRGQGDGGNVTIVSDSVSVDGIGRDGEGSAIFARSIREAEGIGGNINITTDSLSVTNQGQVNVSSSTTGSGGNIEIKADSLKLEQGTIEAETTFGEGGNITLQIADNLTLRNNSTISARALGAADGGNVTIDAKFIIAPPHQNNDLIASAERGRGGNIQITAEGVFGLEERSSTPPNKTNDIDASSEFGLDGTVVINTPDVSVFRETIEAPEILTLQPLGINACSGVGATGASSFNIIGKGGVPPQLTAPLSSDAIVIEGESVSIGREQLEIGQREQIKPLITAQGEIYPARGIIFQENGDIILTAYPTDNVQRTPHSSPHCGAS